MNALLEIQQLSVSYGTGRSSARHAVRQFDFTLAAGEAVAVIGESGSGKTQAFLAALGLLNEDAAVGGSVRFDGRELLTLRDAEMNRLRGAEIGMIFQDPMSALNPYLDIATQLAEVLVTHRAVSWRAAREASTAMLARVQLAEPRRRLSQFPHELSGGMRQRVMIGMALLCGPRLLIADEPTTALDPTVQREIIDLLRELHAGSRMAVVFISHDLALAFAVASRIVVMYAGRVVESAPAGDLFRQPLHPYSGALLATAIQPLAPAPHRLACLPGQPPDPAATETGCAFAPRCARAQARCNSERPLLEAKDRGRWAACHFPL